MRIKYTIYDKNTGRIKRNGESSVASYLHKAKSGEGIIPASSNSVLQKVVDGHIVNKETSEIST